MDQNTSSEHMHEEKVVNSKSKNSLNSFRNKLPSDKKRLFLLGLIVLAIPLTVALALVQQELRSRASEYPATPATPPNPPESGVHRVFVTSTSHDGNLGGLSGADAICQQRANSAQLGGTWKAWLSDSKTSAASRLTHSTVPYMTLNGAVVASDWSDLTDGTLQNPIEITENNQVKSSYVWTGSYANGELVPEDASGSMSCNDWSTNTQGKYAVNGSSGATSQGWSYGGSRECTGGLAPDSLYCIEETTVKEVIPTPNPSGSKMRTTLQCNPVELTDYNSKSLVVRLIAADGRVLKARNITWSKTPGTSNYPLISPSSSNTDAEGYAKTSVWISEGFKGSGSNSVKAEFPGDLSYSASSCSNYVSWKIAAPTVTPVISVSPIPVVQKVTLNPTADAFVRSSAPTTNFGKLTFIETDANPNEISFLKFNLTTLKGKKIVKATLKLRVGDASGALQTVRRADDTAWTEAGINFKNKPGLVSSVNTFKASPLGGNVQIDVTAPIKAKLGQTLTLGITSIGDDRASYYSRETATSNKPQLIIEYQ